LERQKDKLEHYAKIFLAIMFSVGIAGHSFDLTQKLMIKLTPFFLLISFLILSYFIFKSGRKKFILWFVFTYLFTLICEIIGVRTGLIFGNYSYGKTLGFHFWGVPLIIGFNWVFVILGAYQISERFIKKRMYKVIIASFLAVLFDFIMEPVAIKLDYWAWHSFEIPLFNYVSWFSISLLSLGFYAFMKNEIKNNLAEYFFILQFIFFLSLQGLI
jgi:putative membrane protein